MSSRGNEDDPPLSPFVRFKHHIDSNVLSGFNTMLGSSPDASSAEDGHYTPDYRDALNLRSVFFSPYSPAALRHLPQPVPNDLPGNLDGSIFTFEDAFEDLLAVSQGQELPDIHHKYQQKTLLRQMFPQGEPSWFWMRRLRASGLLSLPEPKHSSPGWQDLHQELEKKAGEVWRSQSREGTTSWDDMTLSDAMRAVGSMFGEAERGMGHLESMFRGQPREKESLERSQHEPDTFDEFFSHVQSAYESGQRSWDTFMKTIADQARYETSTPVPRTRIIESRDENVDEYGYVHSKVTRKEIDDEGNEISRSTSYQMFPAPPEQRLEQDCERITSDNGEEVGLAEPRVKKPGWFWK